VFLIKGTDIEVLAARKEEIMIDITWQPVYIIKAYPELRGFFSRGENHLLAYLHNWTVQLIKKGKAQDPEWIFLTQQQIADAIDYSVSSVKRFIIQINQKIAGAVEVRSKQVYLTKFFAYRVWEYRVNWVKVTGFLALQNDSRDIPEMAEMAQSSHLHFELPIVQSELGAAQAEPGVAQNELIYKDQINNQINNQINKKTSTPTLPQPRECESEDQSTVFSIIEKQQDCLTSQVNDSMISAAQLIHNGEDVPPTSKKMSNITSQQAASMGLTRQNNSDGSQAWVDNPAGRSGNRSAWVDQGIALGLWATKDMAFDFQGAVICYGRNQDWCRSPLDYANSVIKGLIRGDDPKADRFWEAWRNELPIGWENLFDWEVQPGVINPAFLTWVSTSLYDSNKTPVANSAEAAKQLRFSARRLWESFQRAVAREVGEIDKCRDRGQTYLPPGAMLPRMDQPTTGETRQHLQEMVAAAESLALTAAQPETTNKLLELVNTVRSIPEQQVNDESLVLTAAQPEATNKLLELVNTVRSIPEQQVNDDEWADRATTHLANLTAPIFQFPATKAVQSAVTSFHDPRDLDADYVQSQIPEPPLAVRLLRLVNKKIDPVIPLD
jgi:hypothetical protein